MSETPSFTDQGGPIKAVIGWIETGSRREAVDYAKNYATRHFDAPSICWYNVMPFLGGWLYEIQEGGPGKSYLPAAVRALSDGAEHSWFRVGKKAFSISMRDGRPFCVLLPTEESKALFESGAGRLLPKGAMKPIVRRGTGVLVFGGLTFATGFLFLVTVSGLYIASNTFVPSARRLEADQLPHRQWSRVERVPPTLFVEKMFTSPGNSQWQTSIKPIQLSSQGASAPAAQAPRPAPPAAPAALPVPTASPQPAPPPAAPAPVTSAQPASPQPMSAPPSPVAPAAGTPAQSGG